MFLLKAVKALIAGGKIVMPYVLGISALTPTKKDDAIAVKAQDTLTHIADLVLIIQLAGEKVPALTGELKLLAIEDAVREVIRKSELLVGKDIDEEALLAYARALTSATADFLKKGVKA